MTLSSPHPNNNIILLDSYFQTLYTFASLRDSFLRGTSEPHIFSLKQSIIHVALASTHATSSSKSPRHIDSMSPQIERQLVNVHVYIRDLRSREKWEHVKMRISELLDIMERQNPQEKHFGAPEIALEVFYVEGFTVVNESDEETSLSHEDDDWDNDNKPGDEDEHYASLQELKSDVLNDFNGSLHLAFHTYTSNTIRIGHSLFILPLAKHVESPFLNVSQYEEFLRSPPQVQHDVRFISKQIHDYLHENMMNCKSSLFALGTFSRWIGNEMQRLYVNSVEGSSESHQKRSPPKSSFASSFTGAGLSGIMKTADALAHGSRTKSHHDSHESHQVTTLILVDRLLDLVPCSAHSSHFLDRITGTLKPVNGNPFDLEVVESSLLESFPEKSVAHAKKSTFLRYFSNVRYASFSTQGDERATNLLEYLLTHSYAESVVHLRETLQELVEEASNGKDIAQTTSGSSEEHVQQLYTHLFEQNPIFCVRHHKLFQFLAVCMEALKTTTTSTSVEYKKSMSLEHLIIQQAAEDTLDPSMPTSVLEIILDQIKQKSPVEDITSLLTLTYALYPSGTKFLCENEIKILLVKEKSYNLTVEQVEQIFQKLLRLNQQRSHFKNYRSLLKTTDEDPVLEQVTGTRTGYQSLFRQLAQQIQRNKLGSDMVHCNSESMTGFISGSLSRFMFSSGDGPPIVPETCENLVIICVGGICGADVAEFEQHVPQIREAFPRLKRIEYGSTVLSNRRMTASNMLGV